MLWLPVLAPVGIAKVATAVPDVGYVIEVPGMLPASVTLVMGSFVGGFGGDEGRVIVTVTVVPRVAVPPGATVSMPLPP